MEKALSLNKISRFVKKYFAEHHKPGLSFHTYGQVESVVKAVEKIAFQYELSNDEYFVLLAAAWFHSTGYLTDKKDYQTAGAELAVKFLIMKKVDLIQIDRISAVIRTPLETDDAEDIVIRIFLDAIFYYLGTASFLEKIELQRKEQQWLCGTKINKTDWLCENYEWIADYKFHTMRTLEKLKPKVDKNLERLKEEIAERLIIDDDKTKVAENTGGVKKKSRKCRIRV